jgi:hypothetical protein
MTRNPPSTNQELVKLDAVAAPAARVAEPVRRPFVPPKITRVGPITQVTTQFAGEFSP